MAVPTPIEEAKKLALVLLQRHQTPTVEQIRDAVQKAVSITEGADEALHDTIVREIEAMVSILIPEGTELEDPTGHEPWLSDAKAQIDWAFWNRYRTWLSQEKFWPERVVDRLEGLTDSILEKLESASRVGKWDRRGMVVGQVQSGKTANYIGLICKAVDAGYKFIVILAGAHNSLRSQTQLRIDEGFLGVDTQTARTLRTEGRRIGVGRIPVARQLDAISMTSSEERGDFNNVVAGRLNITNLGGTPVVLVVKKHGSILRNLLGWVNTFAEAVDDQGARKVRTTPILVLDDEADHASINTKALKAGEDPEKLGEFAATRINARIRQLLEVFEKSAYVGYTATPFANIFISQSASNTVLGEDLFPRSFIINLEPPSNYIGPLQVFGLTGEAGEEQPGLPVIRPVEDAEGYFPSSLRLVADYEGIDGLPDSLREAIRAFVLACAARRARGQVHVHNSMLVHVARFQVMQRDLKELVEAEVRAIQRRLAYGEGTVGDTIEEELRKLWESDFVPTTTEIAEMASDSGLVAMTWEELQPHLHEAAGKIETKEINGSSADILDYYDRPNGVSVIAIGGDKLSRGLTLEGLTISYYLRTTKMYDTLMQMGRWFGYRPGYLDLCRLYTTPELIDWYGHVTAASEELRTEFNRMAALKMTPTQFGLKVRAHPGTLVVTAAGKMRKATKLKVSYANELVESYAFYKDPEIMRGNFEAFNSFLGELPGMKTIGESKHYCWEAVLSPNIISLLSRLRGHPDAAPADPSRLIAYIEKKLLRGEIDTWTVVLINSLAGQATRQIAGLDCRLTKRKPPTKTQDRKDKYVLANRRLISMAHEGLDLSVPEKARALQLAQDQYDRVLAAGKTPKGDRPTEPSGWSLRMVRPKTRGLMLIYPLDPQYVFSVEADGPPFMGYALSFPGTSHEGDEVEYFANQVYMDTFGEELPDDDDEGDFE